MADKTGIEWTRSDDGTPGATWNVVTGCTRISDGCTHCYIERTPPFRMEGRRFDGPQLGATTGIRLHEDRLGLPLRWQRPRRIFVNSLSDLFHESVPDGFIAQVWNVMGQCPQHTFQILTKRPARMRSWVRQWADTAADEAVPMVNGLPPMPRGPQAVRATYASGRAQLFAAMLDQMGDPPEGCAFPAYDWMEGQRWWPSILPNVWLGVSVENQKWADIRIPALLETPAAVRWISAEPLLGPVDLAQWLGPRCRASRAQADRPFLDWVVAGGESGPGARSAHPGWFRSLRDQCQAAGVAFHFKQWGEWRPEPIYDTASGRFHVVMPDGRDRGVPWPGWKLDQPDAVVMERVGKGRAGRELDGRTWDEYPAVSA